MQPPLRPKPVLPRLRLEYVASLDGVRALAILLVLAIHGFLGLNGGFVGVDVFFVLSGFLITALLLDEWTASGRVDRAAFYVRRAARLLPALVVLAVGVAFAYLLFPDIDRGIGYGWSLASVFSYVGNWVQAYHQQATSGRLGLFDPTWSLAIEEQFYLLWPLALLWWLRRGQRPSRIVLTLLILALGSVVLRIATWFNALPGSAYFETDSHADGLLLGCALALVWAVPPGAEAMRRALRPAWVPVTAVALCLTAAMMLTPESNATYTVGIAAVGVAAAALLGHLIVDPEGEASRVFGSTPAVWIGRRSYGIYLYHWPVFSILTPERLHVNWTYMQLFPLRLAAVFAVAALSYAYVETPFRRWAALATGRDRAVPSGFAAPTPAGRR